MLHISSTKPPLISVCIEKGLIGYFHQHTPPPEIQRETDGESLKTKSQQLAITKLEPLKYQTEGEADGG